MNITVSPIMNNYPGIYKFQNKNKEKSNINQVQINRGNFYTYPVFRQKSIPKLYEEYNWYINHDKLPAIQSFLRIEESPEIMNKFFLEILRTKDRSKEFFDSFIYSPRNGSKYNQALSEKTGSSLNNMLYTPNSPYQEAYNRFIDDKYNSERCIISLLKIRPDWRGDVLLEKYKQLFNSGSLEIGNIPKELPHIKEIVKYLRNEMELGVKNKKKIPALVLDNRKYEFAFFTEGKSDKNVFGVFTPEGKKYVIKMANPDMRSLDAPFALGTLAKIDFYLTTHRSRNSAPLCYYNHDENYSVYKYIEHIPVYESTDNLQVIAEHLKDFKALGMSYNDTVGYKNFFMLSPESTEGIDRAEGFDEGVHNREWISVDNDHATYSSCVQPLNSKYFSFLPNAMQMFY